VAAAASREAVAASLDKAERARLRALPPLHAAAAAHDAAPAPCALRGGEGEGEEAECMRCAELRAAGERCAAPRCGARARARADGSAKRLLRCGACRCAAYCGPAHQRQDWERHKGECRAAAAANNAGGGDSDCVS
jgi:hypothetical protein